MFGLNSCNPGIKKALKRNYEKSKADPEPSKKALKLNYEFIRNRNRTKIRNLLSVYKPHTYMRNNEPARNDECARYVACVIIKTWWNPWGGS